MQLRDRQALRGRSAQAAGQASSPVTFSLKPVPSVPASFLTSTPTTFALSQQGPDQPVVPSSVYLAPATRQRPHFPLPSSCELSVDPHPQDAARLLPSLVHTLLCSSLPSCPESCAPSSRPCSGPPDLVHPPPGWPSG